MPLKPHPDKSERRAAAEARRNSANAIAAGRPRIDTHNNGEISAYTTTPTNYHKGLPHNQYGIVEAGAFSEFVEALNRAGMADGEVAPFDVPLGPVTSAKHWPGRSRDSAATVVDFFGVLAGETKPKVRSWESPLGGHAYDLEGPDAGAVGMAPAPRLPFSELCAEMAEVYAMALLRDLPFADFGDREAAPLEFDLEGKPTGQGDVTVGAVFDILKGLSWFDPTKTPYASDGSHTLKDHEAMRRNSRFSGGKYGLELLFRESTHGSKSGPYLSQFMIIGTPKLRGGRSPAGDAVVGDTGAGERPATPKRTFDSRDPRQVAPLAVQPTDAEAAPNANEVKENPIGFGLVTYGAQSIQQRISYQMPGRDYLTEWPLWLDVQNGADTRDAQAFFTDGAARFLSTPRGLATYVHYDALYQAYFVACLLMLDADVSFDYGFPSGPQHPTRGSFATFGGPHILSLMTEVATRGLRAVRRQKFQHHLRGRPEQIAAMLTLSGLDEAETAFADDPDALKHFRQMATELAPLLKLVAAHNKRQNVKLTDPKGTADVLFPRRRKGDGSWTHFKVPEEKNFLLPMAFPEGSPMHPSYGAGHATVAGACVTVLKAVFEMSTYAAPEPDPTKPIANPLVDPQYIADHADALFEPLPFGDRFKNDDGTTRKLYVPPRSLDAAAHARLTDTVDDPGVTLEGELEKLAANVSIGRNMAGVHYYTDYYDSLRLGERVSVGILQEQMATYPEPVTMRLTSFDGDRLVIAGDGKGKGTVYLVKDGAPQHAEDWWGRHVPDPP